MTLRSIFFVLIVFAGIISACKKQKPEPTAATLAGTWHLKKVQGGLVGANDTFVKGEVFWVFDANTNTLTVNNNLVTSDPRNNYLNPILGIFSYSEVVVGGVKTLEIGGQKRGDILIFGNKLTLDEGVAADGFLYTFER